MKTSTLLSRYLLIICLLFLTAFHAYGQRIYANSQRTGATGILCLGCTVTNPANAADGNLDSFSTLNVTVGLAATTYQELIFPGTKPAAGTPVTVKLGTGDNLLSLTALGGVLLQAYNGTDSIGQPVAAATLLSALSNNNEIEVSLTPTKTYDRVRVTLNGGLLGALSSLYLYEGFYNGNAAGACNSAIEELHGVASAALNLGLNVGSVTNAKNAIDGDLTTASTLNTSVGAVGAQAVQTVIFEAPSIKGDSVRLTLSIPNALLQAGVLSDITVSTQNGTNGAAETYSLSSSLLNIRLLDLTGGNQKAVITYAPVNIFDRVTIGLGGLVNALASLNIYEVQKLIPKPVIKFNGVVTNGISICNGSTATLTATTLPNTTYLWYTAATGGSPFFTGNTYTSPVLTANTTYYVAAMRAGCTDQSERTAVTVTVNNIPANPIIANNATTICPGGTATFTAQAVTGVTVNWYTAATGGTPVFTGNSFTTGALTQTTRYYAEAVAGGTCVSPGRTEVTATVSALPDAPTLTAPSQTICDGDVAVFTVSNPVTGVTYNWYSTATGGTSLATGTTYTTPALHSNTSYYAEAVNVTGCPSGTRTQASVTVTPKPADPVLAANNLTISAGQTATINVTNAQTGITYNWYTSATAATAVFTGSTYTTPQLFTNTTYYVGAVNATGCQSANRTAITINVTIDTNTPCSFANQQTNDVNGLCVGCVVTNPALAVDADTTTASTLTTLVNLPGGYAEQNVTFQQAGFAGDTLKFVLGTPANLLDASVLGGIQITLFNGSTQVATYALNNALIKVTLLTGTNKYIVLVPATGNYTNATLRLNSGVATLLTSLQFYYAIQQYPKPVFSPAASEVCKGSTTQIGITSPTNGTFQWFTAPTGGTAAFTGTSITTPALNANTTYYVAYTRGTCTNPVRYPIQILVDNPPGNPVANPSSQTVLSGHTATLNATAANNATVKWYTAATGGTAVATGNTFTTPALTAQTIYYAEASLGNCVSPGRTPDTVNIAPNVIPDIAVTPATQTINPGTTATLTASSTTPGTTFNWYTTPTGGTSVFTGATFTTPALFSPATYYAEATVTATGTKSATRASGVVNLTTSTVIPVACDAAIDQTNSTSGVLCVGCAVNNAAAAVDNDRNTFAQLTVPVGLVNSYAEETLRFANTGRTGDTVVVELGVPGTLASVGVLSQISLATYNGTTYNNDRFNVNSSLISITLLNGTSRFRYAFVAQHDFDRVEIRMNAAVAGVFNSLNVYDAAQEVAAPVISAASITACQGTQATLTAAVPNYVTVKWYTSASGGSPIFTGAVFNTPALTSTTTYYAEASRTADGCTQAVRTPATVTVTPVPAAPVVNAATQTVCSGSPATFTAQAVSGVTFSWYTSATGGTPVFTGNPFVTPALNASATYYVEANGGGTCGSATRTQVNANVTTTPDVPTVAQATVQTCSGSSAVLTASSAQAGVTFNWYTSATGGTPVFTGSQFTTPALTANTSYYVDATAGTCTSATRAKADVNVNPTPAQPVVTITPAGGQISSGQTATLTASSSTAGVTFNWYSTVTGGTPIFTGPTFVTPALTSNTTYYVDATLPGTGCTSPQRTAVNVTVNPVFNTSCDFASSQTNTTAGVCLGCNIANPDNAADADTSTFAQLNIPLTALNSYVAETLNFSDPGVAGDTVAIRIRVPASLLNATVLGHIQVASYNNGTYNGDRLSISSSNIKIQLLSGNEDALIKFVPQAAYNAVEVRIGNLGVSLLNALDIFYATKQVEQPRLAATTDNICSGTTATFTVSNARTGVTYKWYDAATGGNLLATATTFTTPSLTTTKTYYVESSRSATGCVNPNRVAATANVTQSPVIPILTQNTLQICAGDNVTLQVTNAGTATVNWYDAATGGNLLFTGPNYQVSPVTDATYYAELSNGTCVSPSRATATIHVGQRPAQPGVQSNNLTVCTGSPATINVLSPESGVTYKYYTAATGGTSVGSGVSFTTPAITQNTNYFIEASNTTTGCTNNGGRTQVSINVTDQVNAPALSATQNSVCTGGSLAISVMNPVAGLTYNWYTAATAGTLVFTGTTFTANNVTANATYFVEAVNGTGCTSPTRTETDVTVIPIPPSPQVQTSAGSLSVCAGSSASITVINPQADLVYRWYDSANGGMLLFTGTQFNTPVLSATTTYYVEAASAGNCNPSARTAATITINSLPSDPVLVNNMIPVCQGGSATLAIASPQNGVTYQWYDSPARTNLLFTGTTYITGPINTTTDFYVAAVNISGCSSNNLAQAQVSVQSAPSAPMVANGSTVQSCTGSQVTLSIVNPQPGFTYNWYTTATGGTPAFTGATATSPVLTGNITVYAEAVNSTGCTSTSRTVVNINVNPLPVAPVITAQGGSSSPTVCAGSTVVLTATSTTPNVLFNWYNSATGGTAIFTGATYTTPAITIATTYYVEAVSSTGGCSSSTRTAVQINVTQPPVTPVLDATAVNACIGSPAVLSVSNPQTGITYNWYDSATRNNLLFTGPVYTTGPVTADATYYVDAENGTCVSPSIASVKVTAVTSPAAPMIANGTTVNTCNGTSVSLNIADPQSGYTYNWYTAANGGSAVYTGITFNTPTLASGQTFYAEAVNSNGCASATRTAVDVTTSPSPNPPTVNAANISICPGSSATLTATVSDPNATINWFTAATGGTAIATGSTFTTPALTATTIYYAEASNTGGCTSATRTKVTVAIITQLDAPVVSVAVTTTSSVTFTWGSVSGAAGYQVSLNNGQTFTDVGTQTTYTVAGLQPAQSITIVVRATGSTDCQLSSLSAAITAIVNNPFGDGIWVPNAFTPNGDGKNDMLFVYGTAIQSLNFYVYDQWGEMLFKSNSQSNGWDGTYKGTRQPVGVYVYYVEAVMNDGQHVKKKGTITLLR